MNYGQLKTATAQWAHRTDLADQLDLFAQNVTEDLNERFGLALGPLIADTDTNDILDKHGAIYLYGCLKEEAAYTHEAAAIQGYNSLYQSHISNMNINYRGAEWDTIPPVMEPYTDEAA